MFIQVTDINNQYVCEISKISKNKENQGLRTISNNGGGKSYIGSEVGNKKNKDEEKV